MKKLWIVALMAGVLCAVVAEYAVAKDTTLLVEVKVTGKLEKVLPKNAGTSAEGETSKAKGRYILTDETNGDQIKVPTGKKSGHNINLDDYCDRKVTLVGMGYRVEKTRGKHAGRMDTNIRTVTSIEEVAEEKTEE